VISGSGRKIGPAESSRRKTGSAAGLTVSHLQQREGHWAIVDLRGKAGHVRTIPVPDWVYGLLDDWTKAAGITAGSLFRRVSSAGRVWGKTVTEKLVWHVVKEFAAKIGVSKLTPHDLRSYAECRIMPNAFEIPPVGL
jgi:integrase